MSTPEEEDGYCPGYDLEEIPVTCPYCKGEYLTPKPQPHWPMFETHCPHCGMRTYFHKEAQGKGEDEREI